MTRKQALMILMKMLDLSTDPTENEAHGPGQNIYDLLTTRETQLLGLLSVEGSKDSAVFWATAGLARVLASWGHWFSSTIHHCPCHALECKPKPKKMGQGKAKGSASSSRSFQHRCNSASDIATASSSSQLEVESQPIIEATSDRVLLPDDTDLGPGPCPMIGRTGVLLAGGLAELAVQRLRNLSLPPDARASLDVLAAVDKTASDALMQEFELASGRLAFRTQQNFSYWKELPWALMMIMRPFIEQFQSESQVVCLGLALILTF